jgi:hypothetical protein
LVQWVRFCVCTSFCKVYLFRDLGKMTFFSGGDGGWVVRLELRTLYSLDRHSIT